MKYRYLVLRVEKVSELEKYLNQYAEAGWRLVETKWQRPDGVVFIMEREENLGPKAEVVPQGHAQYSRRDK